MFCFSFLFFFLPHSPPFLCSLADIRSNQLTMLFLFFQFRSHSLPRLAQTVESMVLQLDELHGLAGGTTNTGMEEIDHLMADTVNQFGSEADSLTYSSMGLTNQGMNQPTSTDDLTSYDLSHTRASSPGGSSDGYLMESNTKFSVEVTQKHSPRDTR